MGRLRARLRRAEERAIPLYDVVTLKDGKRITFAPGALLDAFCAEMVGKEHPLLDLLPQIDLQASPQMREVVELFVAFRGDSEE